MLLVSTLPLVYLRSQYGRQRGRGRRRGRQPLHYYPRGHRRWRRGRGVHRVHDGGGDDEVHHGRRVGAAVRAGAVTTVSPPRRATWRGRDAQKTAFCRTAPGLAGVQTGLSFEPLHAQNRPKPVRRICKRGKQRADLKANELIKIQFETVTGFEGRASPGGVLLRLASPPPPAPIQFGPAELVKGPSMSRVIFNWKLASVRTLCCAAASGAMYSIAAVNEASHSLRRSNRVPVSGRGWSDTRFDGRRCRLVCLLGIPLNRSVV